MNGVERGSMGAHVRARRACNGPTHLIPSVRTFTRTHAPTRWVLEVRLCVKASHARGVASSGHAALART